MRLTTFNLVCFLLLVVVDKDYTTYSLLVGKATKSSRPALTPHAFALYIYKDVAIDEIDSSIVPSIQRREPDMNNVYDICFNTDNKMLFCKTLKEGFK
jgi:hypothetical protein